MKKKIPHNIRGISVVQKLDQTQFSTLINSHAALEISDDDEANNLIQHNSTVSYTEAT